MRIHMDRGTELFACVGAYDDGATGQCPEVDADDVLRRLNVHLRDSRVDGGLPGISGQLRSRPAASTPRCSRMKTSSSPPTAILLHQEDKLPSNWMSVAMR